MSWSCHLRQRKDMLAIGGAFAQVLMAPQIIFLRGDLGAGKTTLVQGIMRGFGYQGIVKSPTYGLIESYEELTPPVYHFDLYRLHEPGELLLIGLDDYINKENICIFEWPTRAISVLPEPTVDIDIQIQDEGRILYCSGLPFLPRFSQ